MKKPIFNEVIEVPASGKKDWYGGAFTLAYMYSNKGNILFKGYYADIKEYLKSTYSDRKYFIVFNLYPDKRTIINFSNGESIYTPDVVRNYNRRTISKNPLPKDTKYRIWFADKRFTLKRLPQVWNKTMEDIFNESEKYRKFIAQYK